MNKGETVERNERLKKRNERDRARRASETPQQKQERLRKRRERDNAKLPQQKQESLRKRRESERAVLAVYRAICNIKFNSSKNCENKERLRSSQLNTFCIISRFFPIHGYEYH